MLKPKWKNWYLAEWYLMANGEVLLLMAAFMAWYINAPFQYKLRLLCLCHVLFCLALYVLTELFEIVWKKLC